MTRIALCYHDVVPLEQRENSGFTGPGPDRYKLEPSRFAAHLHAIAATGARVALLGDAAGPDDVLLTFDDGGSSAAGTIAPALARRGWCGHFFVPTAHVGNPGFADAAALRELRAAGHVVGTHGHTHGILARMEPADVREEWRRSRAELEDILGEPVTAASVPRGYAPRWVLEAAAEEGLTDVFTSMPTRGVRAAGEARVHGRYAVVASTSQATVAALCRRSPLALGRAAAGWRARQLAKQALGPAYDRLRRSVLARG